MMNKKSSIKRRKKVLPKAEGPKDLPLKKVGVRIIGIGGGGGSIVSQLSRELSGFSSRKIDFIAANTDLQALNSLPSVVKPFYFGQELTQGLGTGSDSDLGRTAAEKEEGKIEKLFSLQKDLFIIISCFGGGTGSGATPVFTKIAEKLGVVSIGIFTLPFAFEGSTKMETALSALGAGKENLNATLVLPNEKIFRLIKKDTPFPLALSILNKRLAESIGGLLRIIYVPGLINIDWADIKEILKGRDRLAYLQSVQAQGNGRIEKLIEEILENRFLNYNFSGADKVLFNIESSKKLYMRELAKVSREINRLSPKAKVIFGISQSSSRKQNLPKEAKIKDKIRITLLATGCQDEKNLERKKKSVKEQKTKEKKKNYFGRKQRGEKNKGKPSIKKKTRRKTKSPSTSQKIKILSPKKIRIRRNALDIERAEKEIRKKEKEEEKVWEIPAFLRRKQTKK